jgi:hypothetical protein
MSITVPSLYSATGAGVLGVDSVLGLELSSIDDFPLVSEASSFSDDISSSFSYYILYYCSIQTQYIVVVKGDFLVLNKIK